MMSLSAIQEQNTRKAREAARKGLTPFVYFDAAEVGRGPFPFPFIGDHRPKGWTMVTEHFVDSSGFGSPGEPALTAGQFTDLVRRRIHEYADRGQTVGWAITSAGQFQVYVGEFKKGA